MSPFLGAVLCCDVGSAHLLSFSPTIKCIITSPRFQCTYTTSPFPSIIIRYTSNAFVQILPFLPPHPPNSKQIKHEKQVTKRQVCVFPMSQNSQSFPCPSSHCCAKTRNSRNRSDEEILFPFIGSDQIPSRL